MKIMRKIWAASLGAVLLLTACAPAVSSAKIEEELAKYCSVTEKNKHLISDAVQDINVEAEADGITLKVLQTITYGSLIYGLAEVDLGDLEVGEDDNIGAEMRCKFAERAHLGGAGNIGGRIKSADGKNTIVYIFEIALSKQTFQEGDLMAVELSKIYRRIDLPPEAIDEEGELKEGYESEEILWQPQEPLKVTWEIENIGKSVEFPMDLEEDMVDGKIEICPMYLRVSAGKSGYGAVFSDEWYRDTEDFGYRVYASTTFARTIRIKHKDGYYIDIFKGNPANDGNQSTGSFNAMRTFFMPLDLDIVESVIVMGREYKLKTE